LVIDLAVATRAHSAVLSTVWHFLRSQHTSFSTFYTHRQPFPTLVRVELMLIFLRLIAYRRRRDDFQLILLGLLLVVASGVYAGSPLFVVQMLVFARLRTRSAPVFRQSSITG
jgi:asparagine N-glycosylation enzyme membrane subunit Stt3